MTSTVSEQFCLKWNNHQHTFVSVFARFLSKEALVDVTLAAEGKHLKAHQMVLSACSEYFEELFTANPCKHPIVILKDVKYEDLKALIQFMYNGEVSVFPGRLSDLLKTAELLKIQSLADVPREDVVESLGDPPSTRGRPRGPKRKLPPPPPDSQQKQGRQYTEEENEYAPAPSDAVEGKTEKEDKRKRSAVWHYFDKTHPKKVICRLCNTSTSYRGNTSNMFRHLYRKHGDELGCDGGASLSIEKQESLVSVGIDDTVDTADVSNMSNMYAESSKVSVKKVAVKEREGELGHVGEGGSEPTLILDTTLDDRAMEEPVISREVPTGSS